MRIAEKQQVPEMHRREGSLKIKTCVLMQYIAGAIHLSMTPPPPQYILHCSPICVALHFGKKGEARFIFFLCIVLDIMNWRQ